MLVFSAAAVRAEELNFITVLSQPVGAFSRLETLNADRFSTATFLNFCNENVSAGTINSYGRVTMNELRLSGDEARAGSSSNADRYMSYQITDANGLQIAGKGSLLGAKLLAASANPDDIVVKAGLEIGGDASFIAADIPSMLINNSTKIAKNTSGYTGKLMQWFDSYTRDYKTGSGGIVATGNTYSSHLLRMRISTGAACFGAPSGSNTTRTVDCSSRYGSSYEGTVNEKYNFATCKWEETSNNCELKDLTWQFYGTSSYSPTLSESECTQAVCDKYAGTVCGSGCAKVTLGSVCTKSGARGYHQCLVSMAEGRCHITFFMTSCM